MKNKLRFAVLALTSTALLLPGQDLTPRELFFAAPAIKAKAAAPAKPATRTPAKPAGSDAVEVAKAKPVPPRPVRPSSAERPPEQIAEIIPAAMVSDAPPLGLRYSLLLNRDNEGYKEVDAATVFRSGDRVKVVVETNDAAYLYILARGSSGLWQPLFPVADVAGGDNLIQPFQRYEIPNGGRWYFDQQAGQEKLVIVLSRKPVPNFEDLLYSVTQPQQQQQNPSVRPAGGTSQPQTGKTFQMASNRPFDDALVTRVRNDLQARDLVFEKVDDSKPGPKQQKETATYVVNKSAGPDGRVLVELTLEHK